MCDKRRYNNEDDDGRPGRTRVAASRRPSGFTLVELVVVIVIIGIILTFMLAASRSALRSAQEKATQGLIAKLDSAVADRVDAILQARVSKPSIVDGIVAAIYDGVTPPGLGQTLERAYVLAQIELYQRELPDVFFVQTASMGATGNYPLNFASNPYPIDNGSPPVGGWSSPPPDIDVLFILPLGMGWPYNPFTGSNYIDPGQGIYGASYHVAAGLYKNLGYWPTGYDGVDNNGNGYVDELAEGVYTGPNGIDNSNIVIGHLANHTHKTARAEVLYALLVDSTGPFGSIFTADDFTDKEVQDTDGDGLPEFVDAWGEPLQFYRWPLLFHSDLQRGQRFAEIGIGKPVFAPPYGDSASPFSGMIEQRELDALDPNQQLMSPAWWSSINDAQGNNNMPPFPAGFSINTTGGWSTGVAFFENYFHLLHEPLFATGTAPASGRFWDRGAPSGLFAARRAFASKFLIISAGPDKELGLFQYDRSALETDIGTVTNLGAAFPLLGMESLAVPLAYSNLQIGNDLQKLVSVSGGANINDPISGPPPYNPPPPDPNSVTIQTQGQDDIHNHNIPAGGIGGSAP